MNPPETLRVVIKSAPQTVLTAVDLQLDHTYGLGLYSGSSHTPFSDYCFRQPHRIKQLVKDIGCDSHVSWLRGVTLAQMCVVGVTPNLCTMRDDHTGSGFGDFVYRCSCPKCAQLVCDPESG